MSKPIQMEKGVKYRDADKMALIPTKTVAVEKTEDLTQAGMDENKTAC